MANVKISGLPAATSVAGANEFEINEAGTSKKVTGSQIASYVDSTLSYLDSDDIGVLVQAYDSTILKDADIGVTVEAYDATILKDADIGVSVQGYDSTTTKNTATQTLTNKTLTSPAMIGTLLEDVYTITDGAGFAIDPTNGSIQLVTLGASRTPTVANFDAGEAVTLMVNDGTAYTITWTTIGVVWVGGTAPTLATSGYTVIELWKVGSTIYGALVGDVA